MPAPADITDLGQHNTPEAQARLRNLGFHKRPPPKARRRTRQRTASLWRACVSASTFSHPDCNRRPRPHTGSAAPKARLAGWASARLKQTPYRRSGISPCPEGHDFWQRSQIARILARAVVPCSLKP